MSKPIDLTGKVFGQLTVVEMLPERKCRCRCSCGEETIAYRSNVVGGHTKSCGCLKYRSRVGSKQGYLTLLEWYKGEDGRPRYRCRCDCGRETDIRADSPTQSCGKCGAFEEQRTEAIRQSGEFVQGTALSKIQSKPTAANKSGVVGINWDKSRGKWQASIRFKGHKYNLGRFDNIQDAIDARKAAEKKYFGELLKWHDAFKDKK